MNHNYSRLPSTTNDIMVRDWRKALRTRPTYRIGNRTVRFQWPLVLLIGFVVVVLVVLAYINTPSSNSSTTYSTNGRYDSTWYRRGNYGSPTYNYTYPLTAPIISNGMHTYRISIIADLDKASKHPEKKNTWRSFYKKGYLSYTAATSSIVVSFDKEQAIEMDSGYSLKGRGMELSELVTFNGRILTFDDRTGMVYEIVGDKVVPWIILMDGDGRSAKGFKSEWASVKDEVLFVGSMGKEWTTANGDFESYDPMYVKAVSVNGEVKATTPQHTYPFTDEQFLMNFLVSSGTAFEMGGQLSCHTQGYRHRLARLYDPRVGHVVHTTPQMVFSATPMLQGEVQ